MKKSTKAVKTLTSFLILGIFFLVSFHASAQDNKMEVNRDSMIAAALEIIKAQNYCALITIDSAGLPSVRTMNPYPVEGDLAVWMATNRKSRKALQMLKNPNVCVYFADHKNGTGYVAINGKAEIIDDKDVLIKKKREYWEHSVPDWKDVLVLIRIIPERLEVVNYKRGLYGDPVTWKAPFIEFKNNGSK